MKKNLEINWKSKPEKEDYASAEEYLALLYDEKKAAKLVSRLKKGRAMTFAAKDIFRASRLPLLDISNAQVKADHKKIVGNKKLSPLLLVRTTRPPKRSSPTATIAFVPPTRSTKTPQSRAKSFKHPGPIVADECGSHSLPWFTLPMAPTSRLGSAHLRRCNCDCRRANFVPG